MRSAAVVYVQTRLSNRRHFIDLASEEGKDDQNKLARDQVELSAKALASPHRPPAGDHAEEGTQSLPRPDLAPSGAFDAEGQRPVLERSRNVR